MQSNTIKKYIHLLLNLLATSALIAISTTTVEADGTEPVFTPTQINSDIALAKEVYARVHPGYTRYASEDQLNQAWDSLEQTARDSDGMSLGDFYLGVQKVLTMIRCDHTKAELPKALIEARQKSPVYLPVRWSVIEGRGMVRVATPESGLKYGDEILSIDDRPLQELIQEVLPYIPVDGYTEWARLSGVAESLEFRGGAIDHFGALLWSVNDRAVLKVTDAQGIVREAVVDRIFHKEWLQLDQEQSAKSNFKDAIRFKRLGENGAYLAVDTFVNYRDYVDPEEVYDPIFDALRDEKRDYLILDLRNNGGGSDDARNALLDRIFLQKKKFYRDIQVKTLDLSGIKQHLWTWEKTALNPNRLAFKKNSDNSYSFRSFAGLNYTIRPSKNAFSGKLIVLTSAANSSGSAMTLAHLQDSKRATLIGDKAGGSAEGTTAGILFTLTLPESGIKTRVPVIRYFTNIESFKPGLSIEPDVYAPMTVADFRASRDPALELAKSGLTE